MILDSTDLRPLLLSRLHIHHWRIRNDLTVWYAQNYTPLKIPTHPTYPDYYSIVIKINILGLSKSRLFTSGFAGRGLGHTQMTDFASMTRVSGVFCIVQVSDVNVIA